MPFSARFQVAMNMFASLDVALVGIGAGRSAFAERVVRIPA